MKSLILVVSIMAASIPALSMAQAGRPLDECVAIGSTVNAYDQLPVACPETFRAGGGTARARTRRR